MKRILSVEKRQLFILASIATLFIGCSSPQPPEKTVAFMAWNIWHGGLHGPKENDFAEDTLHTANIVKVLKEERADVLFMQETYCCGMEIAKEAGYSYSIRGSSNLSIHSTYPIVDSIAFFNAFNSHAAIIDVEGTKVLAVNIWLHYLPAYFREAEFLSADSLISAEGPTRLKEITTILGIVDSLQNSLDMPVVMGGDFNSGSHLDWVESTKDAHFGKVVEWPVSKAMEAAGFIDSFREAKPDPTTSLEGTWGWQNEDIISDRIDYIYYRGQGLRTITSKIVMDDPLGGFFNSDHRAILSTIRITE